MDPQGLGSPETETLITVQSSKSARTYLRNTDSLTKLHLKLHPVL